MVINDDEYYNFTPASIQFKPILTNKTIIVKIEKIVNEKFILVKAQFDIYCLK